MKTIHQACAMLALVTAILLPVPFLTAQQAPTEQKTEATAPATDNSFYTKHKKIVAKANSAIEGVRKDADARQQILKQRDEELARLLDEAAGMEINTLSFSDLQVLTAISQSQAKHDRTEKYARAALEKAGKANVETIYVSLVTALIGAERLEEAATVFKEGTKRYSGQGSLPAQRMPLFRALGQAGKNEAAARLMADYVEEQASLVQRKLVSGRSMPLYINMAVSEFKKANKPEAGIEHIDKLLAVFKDPDAAAVHAEILSRKTKFLDEIGRGEEAAKILETSLKESDEALKKSERDTIAILRKGTLLAARAEIEKSEDRAEQYRLERMDFMAAKLSKDLTNAALAVAYGDAAYDHGLALLQRDKKAGSEAVMKTASELLGSLTASTTATKTMIAQAKSRVESLSKVAKSAEAASERTRAHNDLVGKPAFPLEKEIASWVNGSPIKDADLKGKVVLLDFWAVWCGPCIATFPHLREWQDKFSDKGLVILGLTRHYSFDWDAGTKRPKQVPNLTPAREEEALVEFAQHHNLKHRFGIQPRESTLSKSYNVTGIPQAVLIDRQGNIRLVRVGSGPSNARDLGEMIEKLIAEK